jgi:hypothetical protein
MFSDVEGESDNKISVFKSGMSILILQRKNTLFLRF